MSCGVNVLNYRLARIEADGTYAPDATSEFRTYLDAFDLLGLPFQKSQAAKLLPADPINKILQRF
jgi:hypothetical protein